MSKDKIEVSMSVYDIPIVIEALEKAEDEIKKLQQENQQLKKQKENAIKKLNKYRNRKDHYGLWCMEYIDNADVIHILKGDSDE